MGENLAIVSPERLLAPRLPEEIVVIQNLGAVRVRALARSEVRDIVKRAGDDEALFEALALTVGIVEPKLTEEEVRAWLAAAPVGEVVPVLDAIARLSGITQDAIKQARVTFQSTT